MGPINYMGMYAPDNFAQDMAQGLQAGQMFAQRNLERDKAQAAAERERQYNADVNAAMSNPSRKAMQMLALKYPDKREAYKQVWDQEDEGQKKAVGELALQVSNAMESGQPEIAKQVLARRIEALENSGQDATQEKMFLSNIDEKPNVVRGQLLQWSTFIQDPKNYAENRGKLGQEARATELQPAAVKTANAGASEKQAEASAKAAGVIGQKAGALAGVKGVKPAQVESMFKALAAQGVIPKEELPTYLASIPTEPKALVEYLNTYKVGGMTPKDQMSYTTPDANTRANNATSRANNAASNATTIKVQEMIGERAEARGDVEPSLSDEAAGMMAEQMLAGDKTVLQNLGRGAQGAANIIKVRELVSQKAKARGWDGAKIAAVTADYSGQVAGLRTSGTISARIENAAAEAAELIPIALAASEKVSRSGLMPFGKAQIMFNTQTNDPDMAEFATANLGLATAYAGAMARGGKATVSDMEHAREILTTAKDHKAYVATVNMMKQEIKAAQRAPNVVREHLREQIGGQGGGHGGGHAAPANAPKVVNFGDLR